MRADPADPGGMGSTGPAIEDGSSRSVSAHSALSSGNDVVLSVGQNAT
jgi:hypothetical protein